MKLFNDFYLDAPAYKKHASSVEFAHAEERMNYYCTKNSIPFLDQKDQLIETIYPTNTLFFLKHAAQLILGVAVFVKTLFTDIWSLPDVLFGMICLVLTMALDVINFIASSVSCLLKMAPTINQGYSSKKEKDTSVVADEDSYISDNSSYDESDDESDDGIFLLSVKK